jgi:hypothetical protein
VAHGRIVAAAEAFAVIPSRIVRNVGMAVFVAVLYIRPAMVVVVLASTFDAIMEALALNVAELLRRRIPAALVLSVSVSRGRRSLR